MTDGGNGRYGGLTIAKPDESHVINCGKKLEEHSEIPFPRNKNSSLIKTFLVCGLSLLSLFGAYHLGRQHENKENVTLLMRQMNIYRDSIQANPDKQNRKLNDYFVAFDTAISLIYSGERK